VSEKQPQTEAPKKVPPRNNLARTVLRKQSRSNELQGRDPDFVYQYFYAGDDLSHPGHIDRKTRPHEHGTDLGGYVDLPGWEVCHAQTDRKVAQAEIRQDQGKPVDTLIRRGRQVLCRMHKDEHAKYAVADHADIEARRKAYMEPDRVRRPGSAMTVALSSEEGDPDTIDMLKQAGHPMPGDGKGPL
jgi:hypothetical protein